MCILLSTEKENVFERIVEEKDCDEEEKQIREINGGVYCIENKYITEHISKLSNENKSNEYYLTDLLEIIKNNENERIQTMQKSLSIHILIR